MKLGAGADLVVRPGAGVDLVLLDRPEDLALRSLATGGFFGFWKKVQRQANAP